MAETSFNQTTNYSTFLRAQTSNMQKNYLESGFSASVSYGIFVNLIQSPSPQLNSSIVQKDRLISVVYAWLFEHPELLNINQSESPSCMFKSFYLDIFLL